MTCSMPAEIADQFFFLRFRPLQNGMDAHFSKASQMSAGHRALEATQNNLNPVSLKKFTELIYNTVIYRRASRADSCLVKKQPPPKTSTDDKRMIATKSSERNTHFLTVTISSQIPIQLR
jgi:hypothetical protein